MGHKVMRIAILLDDLSGGGVERTMLTLAGGFVKHGHAVDVVLGSRTGSLEGELPAGARVIVLDARPGWLARLAILRADPGGLGVLARPVLLARQKRLGRMLPRLPSLVAYLRRDRPDVLVWPSSGRTCARSGRASSLPGRPDWC